jgi:hypothetical protein
VFSAMQEINSYIYLRLTSVLKELALHLLFSCVDVLTRKTPISRMQKAQFLSDLQR